jgi:hypothetical protein
MDMGFERAFALARNVAERLFLADGAGGWPLAERLQGCWTPAEGLFFGSRA